MKMENFVLLDTNFDDNRTIEYNLSIQVSLDGFSFSIHHQNSCLALKDVKLKKEAGSPQEQLKDLILQEPLLNKTYNSINALWVTSRATLVPSCLFTPKVAESCFSLCHPLNRDHQLLWQEEPKMGAYIVYSIPQDLIEFLRIQFSQLHIYHQSFPFIYKAETKTCDNHPIVNLAVHNEFIDILILGSENNHFFNTFAFRNSTDLVYHVMNVYSQNKLNPQQSRIILSGCVEPTDEISTLLQKYITRVEFKEYPTSAGSELSRNQQKKFVNLLNLNLCELSVEPTKEEE